jgi:homoserine kinase type II
MAVFTSVTPAEANEWLKRYSIGSLTDLAGIATGIENTNYFLTTSQGRFVLTLFEKLTAIELPFYLNLMSHLARHAIPCPAPVADNENQFLGTLKGKPAAIVSRLSGITVMAPEASHCEQVGATLANMHLAGRSFREHLAHPRGAAWRSDTAPKVMPFLDAARQALLRDELDYQARIDFRSLPQGAIHADLFRDNVLFDGPRIGGVIDFYFAGVDAWLFDVAVTINDWCVRPDGQFDAIRAKAFVAAYAAVRPFSDAERAVWPAMLRAAALRFWLSRLYDFYLPRAGELIHAHDPEHFRRILELRIALQEPIPPL